MTSTTTCSPFATTSCAGANSYYALGATQPTGATCGEPTTSAVLPPPTWSASVLGCGLPGPPSAIGCPSGRICVPEVVPQCIMMSGDVPCPTGSSYAMRNLYFGGFDEGRSCSTCSCQTVGMGSCSGQMNLYSGGDCSGSTQNLQVSFGACTSILAATRSIELNYLTLTEPSCAPSGGVAQGSATAASPTTICCTP
jgi:hypothetical protein